MTYTDRFLEDFWEEWHKRLDECPTATKDIIYSILKKELFNSVVMKHDWASHIMRPQEEQTLENLYAIVENG